MTRLDLLPSSRGPAFSPDRLHGGRHGPEVAFRQWHSFQKPFFLWSDLNSKIFSNQSFHAKYFAKSDPHHKKSVPPSYPLVKSYPYRPSTYLKPGKDCQSSRHSTGSINQSATGQVYNSFTWHDRTIVP